MRRIWLAAALVVVGVAMAAVSAASGQAGPPNATALGELRSALQGGGDKVFGLSPAGNSKGITTVPSLESQLAHPVEVVNIFVGWGETVPTASMNLIVQQGGVPELTFEPWDNTKGVTQPALADRVIASGGYDHYLTQLAQSAAAWGAPFLFRYGHEMNGNWYPWAASVNGNTASSYVAAWTHVHKIFADQGASNALWVWCPNAGGPTPVSQVYPGASDINVIGMDGYNWGSTASTGWRTPTQVFSSLLSAVRRLAPGVPVMINETGSAEAGGSKATWIGQLFSFVESQSGLAGVVYSNFGSLWPLSTSSSALAAARQSLANY